MKHTTFHFELSELDVDLRMIEDTLGYGEGGDLEIVDSLIPEILKEPDLFCNIRAEYRIFDNFEFVGSDKSLNINEINLNINKTIFASLKRAGSLAVFICTAGEEIVTRTRKALTEGDPLMGYIYDLTGSIIVEAAAARMQDELEKSLLSEGNRISNRYGPGYCGWDVSEQHKLFTLFPDNFCGIRLTHSALMDPVKSLSGIIGIGADVRFNPNRCSLCNMKDCSFRKPKDRKS